MQPSHSPTNSFPRLFKPAMVKAILADFRPKTQTRRHVSCHNSRVDGKGVGPRAWDAIGFQWNHAQSDGHQWLVPDATGKMRAITSRLRVNDLLWVKEAWTHRDFTGARGEIAGTPPERQTPALCIYEADKEPTGDEHRWKPSVHMPRWACRIELRTTRVVPERLLDISDSDSIAEGIERLWNTSGWRDYTGKRRFYHVPRWSYVSLWNFIHGPQAHLANPPLWVECFERVVA